MSVNGGSPSGTVAVNSDRENAGALSFSSVTVIRIVAVPEGSGFGIPSLATTVSE